LGDFLVDELPPKEVFGYTKITFQVPQIHEIIISIHLGLRSAESGKLSISPRLVYWLANVFANGWSIAPHKRKTNLLEALTETLLFNYRDIKQEIVHTLLLEKYGVSKKWVITMDRRQDSNATSTPTSTPKGKSGPSAQDRYCARSLRGGAKKPRGNREE